MSIIKNKRAETWLKYIKTWTILFNKFEVCYPQNHISYSIELEVKIKFWS